MEALYSPETWIALATLTALELVLGIDNIIFITILPDACRRSSATARAAWASSARPSPAWACCSPSSGSPA